MTASGIALNDTTFATNLVRGQAGTFANSIATSASRMTSLRAAGYPANLFMVNPTVVNGGAFIVTNGGSSTYNAMQIGLYGGLGVVAVGQMQTWFGVNLPWWLYAYAALLGWFGKYLT